jgi:hypothetical protein
MAAPENMLKPNFTTSPKRNFDKSTVQKIKPQCSLQEEFQALGKTEQGSGRGVNRFNRTQVHNLVCRVLCRGMRPNTTQYIPELTRTCKRRLNYTHPVYIHKPCCNKICLIPISLPVSTKPKQSILFPFSDRNSEYKLNSRTWFMSCPTVSLFRTTVSQQKISISK